MPLIYLNVLFSADFFPDFGVGLYTLCEPSHTGHTAAPIEPMAPYFRVAWTLCATVQPPANKMGLMYSVHALCIENVNDQKKLSADIDNIEFWDISALKPAEL